MKNKKIIGITLLVFVLMFAGYLFLSGKDICYNTSLKANWGISLPSGGEEVYAKEIPEDSFNGDGERFRVYRYDEKPVFAKNIVWSDNVAKESRFLEIVEDMQPEYAPDLSSDNVRCFHMTWERDARNKLWVIYDENAGLVFVVEDFF